VHKRGGEGNFDMFRCPMIQIPQFCQAPVKQRTTATTGCLTNVFKKVKPKNIQKEEVHFNPLDCPFLRTCGGLIINTGILILIFDLVLILLECFDLLFS